MLRTLYHLWRLARRLEKSKSEQRAASINVIVELEEAASYRALCARHAELCLPRPERRTGFSVTYWGDRHVMATGAATKQRETLADALEAALRG